MAAPEAEPKKGFPKGGDYAAKHAELRSRKRVIARIEDGTPSYDIIKLARDVDSRLRLFSGYVGIGPRGSRWLGYAVEQPYKKSDYDFNVLIDTTAQHFDRDALRAAGRDAIEESRKESGKRIHLEYIDVLGRDTLNILAALSGDLIGPHFQEYRARAQKKIMALNSSDREKLLANVAALHTDQENTRLSKISISGEDQGDYAISLPQNGRTHLWEDHVYKIFGIPRPGKGSQADDIRG